ncbi:MAG: tRNA lysidine(34) synthetase TilS [Verrucomicrobiota bacterium]
MSGNQAGFLARLSLPSPPESPHLLGLSGGRDSVTLLHLLLGLGYRSLLLCHLDHGLRKESEEEARFVQALGEKHSLPVIVAREDTAQEARRRHCSIETAAREMRHRFFARIARERDIPRLFLAHHADDQVETLLFRLFRGSGAGGLAGMRDDLSLRIEGVDLRVLRPLLGIWREEIDAYIAEHALEFRDDPSNHDPAHTRNRLRHQIIPALEEAFGRNIRRSLWRTGELLRAEDEWMRGQVGTPPERLSVPELREMPRALQRRCIHAWLLQNQVPHAGFDVVERVRGLLEGTTARASLPGGIHVRRRARQIFLEKPGQAVPNALSGR